jgi:hypothetical protein
MDHDLTRQKSLFGDAQDPKKENMLEIRKTKIGQQCREQLLGYFIDDGTAPTMRRWVSDAVVRIYARLTNEEAGLLCVQLFSDCKKNCQWMEFGPEDYR